MDNMKQLLFISLLFVSIRAGATTPPFNWGSVPSTTTARGTGYIVGPVNGYNLRTDTNTSWSINGGTFSISGTVNGRDISTDGAKLDSLVISTNTLQQEIEIVRISTFSVTAGTGGISITGTNNKTFSVIASSIQATGTPSGTTYLSGGTGGVYAWDTPVGGDSVVISTYCPNIIHIGGDVFIASGTFNPIYGGIYRIQQSTWELTGVEFYNMGVSTWSYTAYNLAYSSSTGATTTWEYVVSYNVEVTTNTKSSGMIEVHKVIPPYAFLALHVTRIPNAGTLPNEFGVAVRYKKTD